MVKRVDNAVYDTFTQAADGSLETGISVMSLENDGVGFAIDDNNADLVTAEMTEAVETAKAQIIAGEIMVHDYLSDNSCPAF
jgi:basic membrane protein A